MHTHTATHQKRLETQKLRLYLGENCIKLFCCKRCTEVLKDSPKLTLSHTGSLIDVIGLKRLQREEHWSTVPLPQLFSKHSKARTSHPVLSHTSGRFTMHLHFDQAKSDNGLSQIQRRTSSFYSKIMRVSKVNNGATVKMISSEASVSFKYLINITQGQVIFLSYLCQKSQGQCQSVRKVYIRQLYHRFGTGMFSRNQLCLQ